MLLDELKLLLRRPNLLVEGLDLFLDARLLRTQQIELLLQDGCLRFEGVRLVRDYARRRLLRRASTEHRRSFPHALWSRRREGLHAVALRFETRSADEQSLSLEAQLAHTLVGQKEFGSGGRLNQLREPEAAGNSYDALNGAAVTEGIDTGRAYAAQNI